MAFNPLQQKLADSGQTNLTQGINPRAAAPQIAALLDDDARSPGHKNVRDANDNDTRGQDSDDQQLDTAVDDQILDDNQDDNIDDGNTADDADGDTDDTVDDNKDDRADDDDQDGDPLTTLEAYAEALEVPIEDLLALTHTFKAAGEERTATLADLITGHKLQVDYDRDKGALADARRTFETEQHSRVELFTQQATVQAQQFDLVEQALAVRLQDPRLAQMREADPAEWTAQVREIETQVNNLRMHRGNSAQQYETYMQQERQAFMAAEGEKLQADVEGWGDDMLKSALGVMQTLGYSGDEVTTVVDSRLIKGALELSTLRTKVASLEAIVAKGKKAAGQIKRDVPKGIKPGKAGQRRKGMTRSNVQRLRNRAKKSGSTKDAGKLIEALM